MKEMSTLCAFGGKVSFGGHYFEHMYESGGHYLECMGESGGQPSKKNLSSPNHFLLLGGFQKLVGV